MYKCVFLFHSNHPVKRDPSLGLVCPRSLLSPFLPYFLLSTVREMVSRTVRTVATRMLLVFSHYPPRRTSV